PAAANDQAEIGHLSLNEREPSVAISKEEDFHDFSKDPRLCWIQTPMHLESHEVVLYGFGTFPSVQIMFAIGEKNSLSCDRASVAKLDPPMIILFRKRLNEGTTPHLAALSLREHQHFGIQHVSRKGERRKRQGRLRGPSPGRKSYKANGNGAEFARIET